MKPKFDPNDELTLDKCIVLMLSILITIIGAIGIDIRWLLEGGFVCWLMLFISRTSDKLMKIKVTTKD